MKTMSSKNLNYGNIALTSTSIWIFMWILPFLFGKYTTIMFPYITEESIPHELNGLSGSPKEGMEWCQTISTQNQIQLFSYSLPDIPEDLLVKEYSITEGGVWEPKDCQSRFRVAIIIPYRDREDQLKKFLSYMHPFLIAQKIDYRVIVVEQTGDALFNRGKLLNIGYIEALKIDNKIDCFIFHDVDLLPQNSLNIYACTHQPRHMYSAIDIFRYHLPYSRLFGGAVAMQSIHFNAINGFSNSFFGWGGEDDDFYNRLEKNGLEIVRFHPNIASYIALPHTKAKPAPDRYKQIYQGQSNGNKEGLLDISYKVKRVKKNALFTWILATC